MWIAIWVGFSLFILGFVAWTLIVLFQQKKAWGAFAKRHKLNYERGTFMGAPTVYGTLDKRIFSLYTGVQQTEDIRGQRFVTVMEFQLGPGMPTGAAVATKEYKAFIDGLIFKQAYKPELAEWKSEYVVRARDSKNLEAWFTKERQQILLKIFNMKNAAVLFFFDEIEAVLRIETSDPLRNEAHLEKITKQLGSAADKLAPTAEEKKRFKILLREEAERRSGHDDEEVDDEGEPDEPDEAEERPKQNKSSKTKSNKKKVRKDDSGQEEE